MLSGIAYLPYGKQHPMPTPSVYAHSFFYKHVIPSVSIVTVKSMTSEISKLDYANDVVSRLDMNQLNALISKDKAARL